MNYRHIYHAGNFADVFKHILLTRIISYLKRKDGAFRVIDTHAGIGLYDLTGVQAQKTKEWQDGIGRFKDATLSADAAKLLAPYLEIALPLLEGDKPQYPGSPLITRGLLRKQDRMTAIELHDADAQTLRQRFEGDYQARIIHLDGWLALGGHLPPKEKRGLVLVDPPFEERDEFARMVEGLTRAHRRWPGGTYALWYPIKDKLAAAMYRNQLSASGVPNILDIELRVHDTGGEKLDGAGMTIVNPPYILGHEISAIMPELVRILALDPAKAGYTVKMLAKEAK